MRLPEARHSRFLAADRRKSRVHDKRQAVCLLQRNARRKSGSRSDQAEADVIKDRPSHAPRQLACDEPLAAPLLPSKVLRAAVPERQRTTGDPRFHAVQLRPDR